MKPTLAAVGWVLRRAMGICYTPRKILL